MLQHLIHENTLKQHSVQANELQKFKRNQGKILLKRPHKNLGSRSVQRIDMHNTMVYYDDDHIINTELILTLWNCCMKLKQYFYFNLVYNKFWHDLSAEFLNLSKVRAKICTCTCKVLLQNTGWHRVALVT